MKIRGCPLFLEIDPHVLAVRFLGFKRPVDKQAIRHVCPEKLQHILEEADHWMLSAILATQTLRKMSDFGYETLKNTSHFNIPAISHHFTTFQIIPIIIFPFLTYLYIS